ncbi:MAG: hypothetical protein A2Y38_00210 [Spirochaetes bacterium GWB1_59_5]|nr:MAG: hypothetical protein A2Y38_00210 [Spirochaetes bacterium GWB1_59_5]
MDGAENMANSRTPPRGMMGALRTFKHFAVTGLWNSIAARKLLAKYSLDTIETDLGGHHHPVAIVAIFKGEDEYLREWLEFHLIVGVSHFYLYDNGNSEASRVILEPYIKQGLVTYLAFPEFPEPTLRNRYGKDQFRKLSMQNLAYGDCTSKHARQCDWLVKIDLDEFIYPLAPYNTLDAAFSRFDKKRIKGFTVLAARFGPSGNISRSGLPVIETFGMRNPGYDNDWKSVGNGAFINRGAGYHGAHSFYYRFAPWARILADENTRDIVRINHYYIKSRDEYLDKIQFHAVGHKAGKEVPDKWPLANDEASHPDDGSILRFLPTLKARLR